MSIDFYTEEDREVLLESLDKTKDLGCPDEKYRVVGHTECFHCNECWRYALMNSMNNKNIERK